MEAKKLEEQQVEEVEPEVVEAEEKPRMMSYQGIEDTLVIVTKIASKNVKHRLKIALRKRDLKFHMGPLEEAREVPDEIKAYSERQMKIFKRHGTQIGGQVGSYRINPEDVDVVNEKVADLGDEFAEALKAEEQRKVDVEEMMSNEVEFNVEPLENDWLGENPDSNDIERLIELDMLNFPDDDDDEDDDEEEERAEKARRARNKKKRSRRK